MPAGAVWSTDRTPVIEAPMDRRPKSSSRAGGLFITLGIMVGIGGGIVAGQPSIGFLAGTALGILCAALVWLRDRRR